MTTELDPPFPKPPLTGDAEKVPSRAFAPARRGFDRQAVDDFLDAVASRLEGLEKELARVRLEAEAKKNRAPDEEAVEATSADVPADGLNARLRSLIAVVERETALMLAQARAEAAQMIADAKNEATRLRNDAQEEAERSIEQARASLERADEEARRMLVDISARRQQMLQGLQQMQERLLGVAQDLDDTLNPVGPRGID